MSKFILEIDLGNEVMQYPVDVAHALREVSRKMLNNGDFLGKVKDINGNVVGKYEVTE